MTLSRADRIALAGLHLRDIPQSVRNDLPDKDFAGPGTSFPIVKPVDVANAAKAIGRAENPASIKANIIRIAYKKGQAFVAQLPEDWQHQDLAMDPDQDADAPTTSQAKAWVDDWDQQLDEADRRGTVDDVAAAITDKLQALSDDELLACWEAIEDPDFDIGDPETEDFGIEDLVADELIARGLDTAANLSEVHDLACTCKNCPENCDDKGSKDKLSGRGKGKALARARARVRTGSKKPLDTGAHQTHTPPASTDTVMEPYSKTALHSKIPEIAAKLDKAIGDKNAVHGVLGGFSQQKLEDIRDYMTSKGHDALAEEVDHYITDMFRGNLGWGSAPLGSLPDSERTGNDEARDRLAARAKTVTEVIQRNNARVKDAMRSLKIRPGQSISQAQMDALQKKLKLSDTDEIAYEPDGDVA